MYIFDKRQIVSSGPTSWTTVLGESRLVRHFSATQAPEGGQVALSGKGAEGVTEGLTGVAEMEDAVGGGA
ncbi:hypothetical protein DAMNIGENAA_33970 [Desulforhabdus amnigena]|uniref:Uncharacterized protein n=1 Tax=Desulforhabdus amnigena TaxID=40218 RepID=A0A9W6FW61_9BACT|nr:hypothetical protein DAMNIGENAA_33970 [Desulforhabdus amnigena]